jgi:hypothetical protein
MGAIKPLIKKNFITAIRKPISTILLLFIPVVFFFVLSLIPINGDERSEKDNSQYNKRYNISDENTWAYRNYNDSSAVYLIGDDDITQELKSFLEKKPLCKNITKCTTIETYNTMKSGIENYRKKAQKKQSQNEDRPRYYIFIESLKNGDEINFKTSSFKQGIFGHSDLFTTETQNLNELNLIPKSTILDEKLREVLQIHLASFLIERSKKTISKNLIINFLPLNTPSLKSDQEVEWYVLANFGFMVAFLVMTLLKFSNWMVSEKEHKLLHLLERQGISPLQNYASWLLTFIAMTILPVIGISLILNLKLFKNTNFIFIFIDFFLFYMCLAAASILISEIFSTQKTSQSVILLVYFSMTILGVAVISSDSIPLQYVFSIFPHFLCLLSINMFLQTKNLQNGMDTSSMFSTYNGVTMFTIYMLYIVYFFCYLLIAYFINRYTHSGLGFFEFLKSSCSKVNRKISQDEKCNLIFLIILTFFNNR